MTTDSYGYLQAFLSHYKCILGVARFQTSHRSQLQRLTLFVFIKERGRLRRRQGTVALLATQSLCRHQRAFTLRAQEGLAFKQHLLQQTEPVTHTHHHDALPSTSHDNLWRRNDDIDNGKNTDSTNCFVFLQTPFFCSEVLRFNKAHDAIENGVFSTNSP